MCVCVAIDPTVAIALKKNGGGVREGVQLRTAHITALTAHTQQALQQALQQSSSSRHKTHARPHWLGLFPVGLGFPWRTERPQKDEVQQQRVLLAEEVAQGASRRQQSSKQQQQHSSHSGQPLSSSTCCSQVREQRDADTHLDFMDATKGRAEASEAALQQPAGAPCSDLPARPSFPWPLTPPLPCHHQRKQAHFSAPSSERRKLMSAPLNSELKQKYNVSAARGRRAAACSSVQQRAAARCSTSEQRRGGCICC